MRRLWLAALVVAVGSCGPPELQHPLITPEKATLDEALLGSWEGDDGKGMKLPLTVSQKAGGVMTVTIARGEEPLVFECHASALGSLKLLNVRPIEHGTPMRWNLVRYAIANGELTVWTLRKDPVKRAVDSGALKGEPGKGGVGDLVITDTPENVARFISKAKRDELFERLATFKRRG